ncbi:MAG: FtsX-like permease family protein, partial [Acidobacteria bacterium]
MTGRIHEWWERVVGFVRGRRTDRDLEDELAAHIEMATEDNLRRGMSPVNARRAAMASFGSQSAAREAVGDQRGLPRLESFFTDLTHAFRGMRRRPAFTGVVVLTLALGIGANTALFSLVETVMLRRLPVREPQQLFFLQNVGSKGANGAPPYPCFELFREQTRAFDGMAAFVFDKLDLLVDGQAEQVSGELASGSYFELLGVRPAIGRLLTAADDQLQPPVAVIGYRYWQRRFGGDRAVLGKVITYKRVQMTIVGVIEEGFLGLTPGHPTDVTLPFTVQGPGILQEKGNWGFDVVARLRPDVSIGQARAQVDAIFQNYMAALSHDREMRAQYFDHMELAEASKGLDTVRSRFSRPLLALMGLVGLVLLVGCANLASLFMAHTDSRRREFAIRLTVGAGRGRLLRQLLTEILLLFGLGAALGLVFALWGSRLLAGFLAVERTPVLINPHLNTPVLVFTACIALLTGLVFGALPVLGAVRTAPYPALHETGNRSTDSRTRMGVRQVLVVTQVALSLTLLVGAGLFVRTLANLDRLDLGFRPHGVLTLSISPVLYMTPAGPSYTDERLDSVWAELLGRVRASPGVESASLAWLTPLSGRDRGVRISVPGVEADPNIGQNHVSDGYFETFGIPVV